MTGVVPTTKRTVQPSELAGLVGTELGVSSWIQIDQERIDQFADITEDRQFIHVDKAAASRTPFGGTISHGYLTLSLLTRFYEDIELVIQSMEMNMNYGFDKVRFLTPVPSGSKVRGRFTLKQVNEKKPGQFLLILAVAVEIEGKEKPALIADWLIMQITA